MADSQAAFEHSELSAAQSGAQHEHQPGQRRQRAEPEHEENSASPNKKAKYGHRAKVYRLDEDDGWNDNGIGLVRCLYRDSLGCNAIFVVSEDDPSRVLLEAAVVDDDIYVRNADTIITWCDPAENIEIAVSFEEERGCLEIWQKICSSQGRISADFKDFAGDFEGEFEAVDHLSPDDGQSPDHIYVHDSESELPPVHVDNLLQIAQLLMSAGPFLKSRYADTILGLGEPYELPDEPAAAATLATPSPPRTAAHVGASVSPTSRASPPSSPSKATAEAGGRGISMGSSAAGASAGSSGSGGDSPHRSQQLPHGPSAADESPPAAHADRPLSPSLQHSPHSIHHVAHPSPATPRSQEVSPPSPVNPNAPYLVQLLDLFDSLERRQDLESLYLLFDIIKGVALLDDKRVFDMMLADENFERIAGVLEYDPDLLEKVEHRRFLRNHVEHKEIVPIHSEETRNAIHKRFRISFLRDVLLARALDESCFKKLNTMDGDLAARIAQLLHQDPAFFPELFDRLHETGGNLQSPRDHPKRQEILAFLAELCELAQKMQVHARNAFYRSLTDKGRGFYFVMEHVLADPRAHASERLHVMEILMSALKHDPSIVRVQILAESHQRPLPPRPSSFRDAVSVPASVVEANFARSDTTPVPQSPDCDPPSPGQSTQASSSQTQSLSSGDSGSSLLAPTEGALERNPPPLMEQLIKCLASDDDPGVQIQCCDILRHLLDPETMEASDKDNFLTLFYDVYVWWVVDPLSRIPLGFVADAETSAAGAAGAASASLLPSSAASPDSSAPEAGGQKGYSLREMLLLLGPVGVPPAPPAYAPTDSERVAFHLVCDLLCSFVQMHAYRIKYFVLRNNIIGLVLRLLRCRDKHLILDAIRFVRTCVGLRDKLYNDYLTNNNVFAEIFAVFRRNKSRDNLINSAIIELVEFIRAENMPALVSPGPTTTNRQLSDSALASTSTTDSLNTDPRNPTDQTYHGGIWTRFANVRVCGGFQRAPGHGTFVISWGRCGSCIECGSGGARERGVPLTHRYVRTLPLPVNETVPSKRA